MRPCNIQPKYDGITAAGVEAQDEREAIYDRDKGICQTCHKPVAFDAFELAHRIANTKANRLRWGDAVIDARANKVITHPGRCNSAQNIGGRPEECKALAEEIQS